MFLCVRLVVQYRYNNNKLHTCIGFREASGGCLPPPTKTQRKTNCNGKNTLESSLQFPFWTATRLPLPTPGWSTAGPTLVTYQYFGCPSCFFRYSRVSTVSILKENTIGRNSKIASSKQNSRYLKWVYKTESLNKTRKPSKLFPPYIALPSIPTRPAQCGRQCM